MFVFVPSFLVQILVVISKNVHFYLIKSTFLDITTNIFTRIDGRKTNNTSFECPNVWPQHSRGTALPLFQGLPRNLLFKKCIFYEKGCVTAPDKATQLYLTYFVANIKG